MDFLTFADSLSDSIRTCFSGQNLTFDPGPSGHLHQV